MAPRGGTQGKKQRKQRTKDETSGGSSSGDERQDGNTTTDEHPNSTDMDALQVASRSGVTLINPEIPAVMKRRMKRKKRPESGVWEKEMGVQTAATKWRNDKRMEPAEEQKRPRVDQRQQQRGKRPDDHTHGAGMPWTYCAPPVPDGPPGLRPPSFWEEQSLTN